MLASTRSATGLRSCECLRFKASTSACTSHIRSRSSPVSYSPPSRAAMTLSEAGCDAPQANGEMATSRMSAPASTAAMYAIGAMPLEQCEWMSIGTLTTCFSAVTSSQVAWGLSSPDVLDDDVVAAHVDQALGQRAPQLEVVRRGHGIAERALHMLFGLERRTDRCFHVAQVIERVEDAEHVDAALGRVLDEELHCIVGEVAVGDQVLAADERLDGRVGRRLVQLSQVLPRVFPAPHLRLKRRAAESLHGDEAELVHLGRDGDDLIACQVTADQRLLRVTKRGVEQANAGRFPGLGHHVARAARLSAWRPATAASSRPRMRAASQAAFFAPASPMATVATGMPAGICTIEYRESTPPRCCVGTGTPITGR